MAIRAKYFLVAKAGNPAEHNDDAAEADATRGRFAISDGATESGFARVWSRLLVDQFVKHTDVAADDWSWLPATQQQWLDELKDVEIPWYGEQQFAQGAFATFLGVLLTEPTEESRSWRSVAVGDSCLFHTRERELLNVFPLEKSEDFGRLPELIGSRTKVNDVSERRAVYQQGEGRTGDRLWLISDGLSKWCLAEEEAGRPSWTELADCVDNATDESFAAWVDETREKRDLENDDVALMLLEL